MYASLPAPFATSPTKNTSGARSDDQASQRPSLRPTSFHTPNLNSNPSPSSSAPAPAPQAGPQTNGGGNVPGPAPQGAPQNNGGANVPGPAPQAAPQTNGGANVPVPAPQAGPQANGEGNVAAGTGNLDEGRKRRERDVPDKANIIADIRKRNKTEKALQAEEPKR